MPQQHAPVGEIRHYSEGEVESPLPGNLWVVASNGSWWVHPDAFITTPSESSYLQFNATLKNANGYVLINLSPSINGSVSLVGFYDEWVTCRIFQMRYRATKGLQASYIVYFRPQRFSYNRQQSCFHPSAVGVSRLVRHQFLKGILPNKNIQ